MADQTFHITVESHQFKLPSEKLATIHFWSHLLGGIGMGAFMGMAGLKGMLRRIICFNGEFTPYMMLAVL